MLDDSPSLPDFTRWPSFPFEGEMRVKHLNDAVAVEPPRSGEDAADCVACNTPDDAYIWVSERWRVRGMDRPTGLPMVLILECRSHLDLGDLPNLLSAELGVMTVRLERAIRSLDGVARVHVNRWGDGSAHLHLWFLARPLGRLQLRGTFLSLWDDILPVIPEEQWLENLGLVAAWLAGFGGRAIAEPAHIHWESPSTFSTGPSPDPSASPAAAVSSGDDEESVVLARGASSVAEAELVAETGPGGGTRTLGPDGATPGTYDGPVADAERGVETEGSWPGRSAGSGALREGAGSDELREGTTSGGLRTGVESDVPGGVLADGGRGVVAPAGMQVSGVGHGSVTEDRPAPAQAGSQDAAGAAGSPSPAAVTEER